MEKRREEGRRDGGRPRKIDAERVGGEQRLGGREVIKKGKKEERRGREERGKKKNVSI